MRVLTTKGFSKFARSEGITIAMLRDAVKEMEDGLTGDPLGSSVFKKRVRGRTVVRAVVSGPSSPFEHGTGLCSLMGSLRISNQIYQK